MVRWLCYRCSSSRFDWSYDSNLVGLQGLWPQWFLLLQIRSTLQARNRRWGLDVCATWGFLAGELSPGHAERFQLRTEYPGASAGGSTAGSEFPENECRTDDPSIDPDTLRPNRRRRRGRSAVSAGASAKGDNPTNQQKMNE